MYDFAERVERWNPFTIQLFESFLCKSISESTTSWHAAGAKAPDAGSHATAGAFDGHGQWRLGN